MTVQFLDDDFLVNTTTAGEQYGPRITTLTNGGFVVIWNGHGQVFDAAGNALGDEFTAGYEFTAPGQTITALTGGGFAIVWLDEIGPFARVFDATGTALGADFFVGSIGSPSGEFSPQPQITALANGDFVVTWPTSGERIDILARVFGATGTPRGDAFPVNTTTSADRPQITALADGGFVVIWSNGGGIFGHVCDANGPVAGEDFSVDSSSIDVPEVAALTDGSFAVTWDAGDNDLRARVFDAAGTALGAHFPVNDGALGGGGGESGLQPDITALANGKFVVTWTAVEEGFDNIRARIYDASGNALVDSFPVNSTTAGDFHEPRITTLADGGFVVTWVSRETDSGEIRGRVFDANGNAVGEDFLVNTTTDGDQDRPQITALANGGFAVTWDSVEGASREIRARVFGLTPDNQPPVITSDDGGDTAAKSVAENSTLVTTLAANDPDSDQTLTFLISGGEDAGLFELRNGNELHFIAAPDFENLPAPGGTAGYQVAVEVSDGHGGIDGQEITVTVTDVNEAISNGNAGGRVTGSSGNDLIDGQGGNDTINAGAGNDTIIGGPGRDYVNAGNGDDTIVATIGDGSFDVYSGGAGSDAIDMSGITAPAIINLALSFVSSSQTGLDALVSIENVIGGSGNDAITGNNVANRLDGQGGNDTIVAGSGNDIIIGGTGNDTMNGGPGNDTFIFVPGFGNDRILGFDANPSGGQDLLDISAFGITNGNFATRVTIADVGADTLITIDGDAAQTIRLVGIGNAGTVTQADFLL